MPTTAATPISVSSKGKDDIIKTKRGSSAPEPARSVRRRGVNSPDRALLDKLRHPWEKRKALSELYEEPISGREGWWRTFIRETPAPGAYGSGTFLEDIEKKPNTYRFKSDGRKIDAHPHGKGAFLMPGAYEKTSFVDDLNKSLHTYSFKTVQRDATDTLNFGRKDKDINISPTAYNTEKFLTLTTEKQPSKHMVFKSQSRRFPTIQFVPKEGPAPGNYEYVMDRRKQAITSSFKSRTPRFSSSHTRVPGPGTYEQTFQSPMASTIAKMGRQHGLFFSSAFQA
ncbi:hypothetical protein ACJMK2_037183 [Sinanodonta woodiana]|uniref:Uncharacterized protein n=1 Tax=Sinanodonta woodiana TaxID=1069815 RepID=A0ABD3WJJ6_SINWO